MWIPELSTGTSSYVKDTVNLFFFWGSTSDVHAILDQTKTTLGIGIPKIVAPITKTEYSIKSRFGRFK